MKIVILLLSFILLSFASLNADTSIYAFGRSPGWGFNPGVGLLLENKQNYKMFGYKFQGEVSNQDKGQAESGYTYATRFQTRINFYDIYLGIGYGWSGYKCKFENGSEWEKNTHQPFLSIGYEVEIIEFWFSYHFPEQQTNYHSSAFRFGYSLKVYKNIRTYFEYTILYFDFLEEREHDSMLTFGMGYRF